jgi:hypothetical protein
LIQIRPAPFHHADPHRIQAGPIEPESKNMRNRTVSLNSPEPDDEYSWRHYDASWRSVKAGALLAVLVAALALLV